MSNQDLVQKFKLKARTVDGLKTDLRVDFPAHVIWAVSDRLAELEAICDKMLKTAEGKILEEGIHNLFYLSGNKAEIVGPHHCEVRFVFSGPQQWHRPNDCFYTKEAAQEAKDKL